METKEAGVSYGNSPAEDNTSGEVVVIDGNTIDDGVRRALKSRHLQMIALGGVIGPGTFYATGYAIRYSGPVGALIGYIIIGLDVFFVTQSLGEMTTLFPSTGSFNEFAGRFVDPALSFALGWNYWYMWVSITHYYRGGRVIRHPYLTVCEKLNSTRLSSKVLAIYFRTRGDFSMSFKL